MQNKQLELFKEKQKPYGGEYFKTRAGRAQPRPLDSKNTMHLVLRASKARGEWSFWKKKGAILGIVRKFSSKNGIKLLSLANVGNHLHFHIKLSDRYRYSPFIRAITSAIAMEITGKSRWLKIDEKFWDLRPFTRVVFGRQGFLVLRDYV